EEEDDISSDQQRIMGGIIKHNINGILPNNIKNLAGGDDDPKNNIHNQYNRFVYICQDFIRNQPWHINEHRKEDTQQSHHTNNVLNIIFGGLVLSMSQFNSEGIINGLVSLNKGDIP
ncbi:hypothetical protein ACJX0J_018198, partial [Zea mays]